MATEFSLNNIRYEEVRSSIIEYLSENNEYSAEFDFDGSNLAYQIDVASYVAMMLSYQNVLKSNEIFIDTTQIRKTAVSLSKTMGYRPKRKVSSRFTGTIEYIGDADSGQTFESGDSIIIPARTLFTSTPNGYTFQNTSPITLSYQNSVLLSGTFTIYEGSFKSVEALGTGQKNQEIVIDADDVAEDNMSVFIRDTGSSSEANFEWTQASSFFSLSEETIYFVEESVVKEYTPKILFGDGILGQIPTTSETVEIEYLQTKGDTANGETSASFTTTPTVTETGNFGSTLTFNSANLSIVIPALQVSYSGSDSETLTEIQFNAPRFNSSGDRGITAQDLNTILQNNFSATLLYYNVVGGDSLYPGTDNELGKTYITAVPTGIDESNWLGNAKIYLYETEENEILPQLRPKTILGTERRFIKPSYMFIDLNPYIEVGDQLSTTEVSTITANVQTALETYYSNTKALGTSFRYSNYLNSVIDTNGVVSADIDVTFNFLITHDSFYDSRDTTSYLPIIYSRDNGGVIIYDDYQNPTTTNFVKKRVDIISEENEKRLDSTAYTQFTLPIAQSSIYGSLTHDNSTRLLYNIDISFIEFMKFEMIGTTDNPILSWTSSSFSDANGITYVSNITETGTNQWKIQLNDRNVGILSRNSTFETFQVTGIDTTYLSGIGFEVDPDVTTNVSTVETVADTSGSLNDQYFLLYSEGDATSYYVWYNVADSGTDPSTISTNTDIYGLSFTAIEVTLSTNDIASTVATNTASAITAISDFSASVDGTITNRVTITNASTSTTATSETDEGIATTGFSFNTTSDDVILLEKITETNEQDEVSTFYSVYTYLTNTTYSDLRIYSVTPLCTATFDTVTSTWTYTNTPTFKSSTDADVTFAGSGSNTEDEGLELTDSGTSTTSKILTMSHDKGSFSITNQNNEILVPYSQRNDFLLEQQYTMAQASGNIEYEYSRVGTPDANNIQIMIMNEPASHSVTVTAQSQVDKVSDEPSLGIVNTSQSDYKLIDNSTTNFVSADVEPGYTVFNLTLGTSAQIISVDDADTITLDDNIFTGTPQNYCISNITHNRSWFKFHANNSSGTMLSYYVWYNSTGVSEISNLHIVDTTIASYLGKYCILTNGDGQQAYVWFKNNGSGTDPAENSANTDIYGNSDIQSIEANLLDADAASEELITVRIAAAIDANENFTACKEPDGGGFKVEITNSKHGDVVGAAHGAGTDATDNNEFTISAPTPGTVGSSDPIIKRTSSSTSHSGTTKTLTDSAGIFTSYPAVSVGDRIKNTTDGTFANVVTVTSATELLLDIDIFDNPFSSAESYEIYDTTNYETTNEAPIGIQVDLDGTDTEFEIATATATAITATSNVTASVDDTSLDKVNIDGVYDGKVDLIVDGPSLSPVNPSTGFTFALETSGATNTTDNLTLLEIGDLVRIVSNGNTSSTNVGYFELQEVDSTNGILKFYNNQGTTDSNGHTGTVDTTGVLTHYSISSGTFGQYNISVYDIFHDSSIGTVNYTTGEVKWKQSIKGYTDYENKNTYLRHIKTVFDNYSGDTQNDKIRVTSVDNVSNSGVTLGPLGNFDSTFNIFPIANISTPVLKV